MKKLKFDPRVQPTQVECDLGRHLDERVYRALKDFQMTTEIAGIKPSRAASIMIAILLDAAFTGMLAVGFSNEDIETILNARLHEALRKEQEHEQATASRSDS